MGALPVHARLILDRETGSLRPAPSTVRALCHTLRRSGAAPEALSQAALTSTITQWSLAPGCTLFGADGLVLEGAAGQLLLALSERSGFAGASVIDDLGKVIAWLEA